MSLFSLQIEKHLLGGLLKHPEVYSDIYQFISSSDFYIHEHGAIYSAIAQALGAAQGIDKVIIAEKLTKLGIKFQKNIDPYEYIDSISFTEITPKGTVDAAKEVVKLSHLRKLKDVSDKISKHVSDRGPHQDFDATVGEIDAIYGQHIEVLNVSGTPERVNHNLYELALDTGRSPIDEVGLVTPFPEFNRLWGGLRDSNVYAVAARPAQGKTTFLNFLAHSVSELNNGLPVLVLDTEMSSQEIKFRQMANISGVPLWYIETGHWTKKKEYVKKIESLKEAKANNVFHYHIRNKSIEEVCSIVRRWHLANVKRGQKCLIIYDYLKIGNETATNKYISETQIIGHKVDILKSLSEEIKAPVFTAIQINRTGESSNRQSQNVVDDSSVIALSDRLQWYGSFVAILRRKTADEIELDTEASGTHKLIPVKTRYQGRDAAGHQDNLQRRFPDGTTKYVPNYINLDINNFRVIERGSLRDSILRQNEQHEVTDVEAGVAANLTL